MASTYVASITLGFTPANGDLIGGTVNGVEVSGEWNNGVILYKGALDVSTYGSGGRQRVCSVGIIDGQAIVAVEQDSAPTTDYELHLYRYTPAGIVQIPQEYVEGLEDAASKNDPEFTGSFSQNRNPDTTIGQYSHAEGSLTTASGSMAHAEGTLTIASGSSSHAEGCKTIAQGKYQHVEGYYNIPSGDESSFSGSDYVHIVGNGKFEDARSNAHTLTWSGVPWYKGRPQFGGNAMDDGAKTVMGNGDKEIVLSSSTPDSTKQIKITVSDDARPTFTDTSDPTNTWTPGENLPTVTASDSGKFLRVSESGVWEAEETAIPSQPIIVDAEANMSTGSITISSEDSIQKMNAIDTAYKAGKPCSAYLRYLVNNSYMWCALIAAIGSSDSYNFLFASSSPNHQFRVEPSTNGDWIVADDGPTEN